MPILLLIVPFGLLALLLWRLAQSRQSPGASASGANLGGGGGGFGGGGGGFGGAGGQARPAGSVNLFGGGGFGGGGGGIDFTALLNGLIRGVTSAIQNIFAPSGNNPSPASVNEFSTTPGAPQIGQNLGGGLGIFEGSGGMTGADVMGTGFMGSDLGAIGNFTGVSPAVGGMEEPGLGDLQAIETTVPPVPEASPTAGDLIPIDFSGEGGDTSGDMGGGQ